MSEIGKILEGIDATEVDWGKGWWETSAGAKFGAEKLQLCLDVEAKLQAEIERLEAEVTRWQTQSNMHYMRVCELEKQDWELHDST